MFSIILAITLWLGKNDTVAIPLHQEGGLSYVELNVNGESGMFLIDTGCTTNVINSNHRKRKKYHFKIWNDHRNSKMTGIGGSKSLLRVGPIETHSLTGEFLAVSFWGADLTSLNSTIKDVDIVGIIGQPFFENYHASIDFDTHTLNLRYEPDTAIAAK